MVIAENLLTWYTNMESGHYSISYAGSRKKEAPTNDFMALSTLSTVHGYMSYLAKSGIYYPGLDYTVGTLPDLCTVDYIFSYSLVYEYI